MGHRPKITSRLLIVIQFFVFWGVSFSEYFCAVTSADIQRKIAIGTGKKRKVPPEEKLSVEKVADRFNQVNRSKLSSYFWALHFVFHFQVYIGILRFLVLWRAKYQTTRKKKNGN